MSSVCGSCARESAEAHDGHRDGDAGLLGERAQLFAGIAADDAAAGVDDRPLGQLDRRGDLVDLLGLGARVLHAEAGQIGLGVVIGHRLVQLHVFRHVDEHRSLPAGRGDDERLVHDAGDVVHVGHQVVMLGDAAADFDDRRFLERVGADHLGAAPGR